MPDSHSPDLLSYVFVAIVVSAAIILRFRRMRQLVPFNLSTLWIFPTLYTALAVAILSLLPLSTGVWGYLLLALLLGVVAGWYRGKTVRISKDPESGRLMQQASPLGILVIVALIVLRQGLRVEALALGLNVNLVTDVLVVFAAGLLGAGAVERYVRAKRIMGST